MSSCVHNSSLALDIELNFAQDIRKDIPTLPESWNIFLYKNIQTIMSFYNCDEGCFVIFFPVLYKNGYQLE